jgi:hypothetical protein
LNFTNSVESPASIPKKGVKMTSKDASIVFSLTNIQLLPAIEAAVGEAVVNFKTAVTMPDPRGFMAEKAIIDYCAATVNGKSRAGKIFVKWFHRSTSNEGKHYHFLQHCGAPIPKLYGVLRDPENREILLLEYLDSSHDAQSLQPQEKLFQFVSLLARFAAVRPAAEYIAWMETFDWTSQKRILGAENTMTQTWQHALCGELGEEFREFCSKHDLALLQRCARQIAEATLAMPRSVVHGDFSRGNTGRQMIDNELVVLDLELTSWGPRFYDAGGFLGGPAANHQGKELHQHLLEHYLSEYAGAGAEPPALEAFRRELDLLWGAQVLALCDFRLERALDGKVFWTDDREEGRKAYQEEFLQVLENFLANWPQCSE